MAAEPHAHARPGTWPRRSSAGISMDSSEPNETTGYCSICDVEFEGTFEESQQFFISHEHCFLCHMRWHIDSGWQLQHGDLERLWLMASKHEYQPEVEGS